MEGRPKYMPFPFPEQPLYQSLSRTNKSKEPHTVAVIRFYQGRKGACQKTPMLGKIEGGRRRGRQRVR